MKEPDRKPRRKSKLDPAPARGQTPELEGSPGSTVLSAPGAGAPFDGERKLRELEFLHEFAKLLTTARNWDELMRTIVDRTTTALTSRSAPSTSWSATNRAFGWLPPTASIATRSDA